MSYTVTEFIDNRLDHYFSDRSLYAVSPFNVDDLRDCILMSIIKAAYDESERKQSLRANRGNDLDDQRMRDSRYLTYAQHFRNLQNKEIIEKTGHGIPELLPDDVESMEGKIEGHKVNRMQYFEINTMADHPVFRKIINKSICNVKKVSNEEFRDLMQDYENVKQDLIELLEGNDDDVIFATIQLFTLEWKYNIELFYACAVAAEENKIKEVPKERVAKLCAQLTMPLPPYPGKTLSIESRYVLHRLELVKAAYTVDEESWDEIVDKLWHYFVAQHYIETEIVHKWSLPEYFYTHIPRSEWAKFFREHYDIRKIYVEKEWTNKRIRYVRDLYSAFVKDMEIPKL